MLFCLKYYNCREKNTRAEKEGMAQTVYQLLKYNFCLCVPHFDMQELKEEKNGKCFNSLPTPLAKIVIFMFHSL